MGWGFVLVHHYLAYVVIGALLLHVGIKLPDIVYGLRARMAAVSYTHLTLPTKA